MKTQILKTAIKSICLVLVVNLVSTNVNATNYLSIYMDNITNNNGDTIYYCPNYDSIMVYPSQGISQFCFIYNNGGDTLCNKILILPGNYSIKNNGIIQYFDQNSSKYFQLRPLLTKSSKDKTIVCGAKIQFDNPITDYMGSGITYAWHPADGLNLTDIAQPTAEITSDKTYTLTATTPDGCIVIDSVKVKVNPLLAFADDVTVACGNTTIQMNVTSNYTGSNQLTYNWLPVDNLNATNINNPVATITNSASYTVEIATANGCKASKEVNININGIDIQAAICMVTVDNNNKNVVVWQKPSSNSIDSLFIYRESIYQSGTYDLIGKSSYLTQSVFVDTASNALIQSNRYKTAIKDVCGYITEQSPAHKTIHLNINKGQDNTWNLIWEEYVGFPVSSYRIFRGSSIDNLTVIGSTASGNTSYTDFSASSGNVFYQIEVIPPYDCSNLKSNNYSSSHSNISSNTILDIPELSVNSPSFSIYPVPVKDELYLNIPLLMNPVVTIISIDGSFILNYYDICNEKKIAVNTLPKGMYIIRIKDDRYSFVTKFIKE